MGITVNVRPKSDISVLELTGVINREVKQKRLERTRDSLKRMPNRVPYLEYWATGGKHTIKVID